MEVENVRVVVRIKPMSEEEITDGVANIVAVDGQVITMKPAPESTTIFIRVTYSLVTEEAEDFLIDNIPLTPKSTKSGPPRTPKTPIVKSLSKPKMTLKYSNITIRFY